MALLKFLKGNYSSLNSAAIAEGQVLICGDTGEMFVDVAADKRVKIGDFVVIDTIANLEALDASAVPTSRLYYVEDGNILARSNGSAWIQINKQPTADQIKTMIGLANYETKTDAAQKLTDAKAYADAEVAKVQEEVDDLEALVGTLPEGDAKTIVAYVDAKTTGIATDAALENLQKDLDTAEEKIAALEEANAEGGAVAEKIADAQEAADNAAAAAKTADDKAVAAQKEVDALETVVSEYKTANDAAVKSAADAAKAAQDDVDALEEIVGEVPTGETVVGMIGAAEQLAADAMTEAGKKVASVAAGDASVTIGGTSTAPTVAAKLSADADNALELVEDGLKVVIPAAAEYSIVKAEDSGDYAAVYNLTKNGSIVGASINIPKDLVVKSGSVVGDEIVLVLNDEANTEIKIPAASLIEYVTSGSATGDMVVINVSDDHKVTATITDGTVGIEKLTTDVQTKINKAHSHENADVLAGITADQVAAWDKAEENAAKVATDLNTAMNTRVEALEAIDHEHANKELLDTYTQTEADLADAVAKKHAHANEDVLDGIDAEKVAAWDAAEGNAKAYADGKDAAIAEAKKAGTDAQANLETFEETYATDKTALEQSIGTKANSADVYAKTETYTQEEVDAAIEAAVEAQMSWGSF